MSRLAEIYKSEKAKGGGLVSALGKRTLEKIDPRQMFNQKGLAAAIAPSLFKSYSATRGSGKTPTTLTTAPQVQTQQLESKIDGLISETRNVSFNTQLAAKNSMTMPDMARDMNVMRQNIIKLVKLQGGEATNKADMYFRKSSERETAYETQFGKQKNTAPTPVKESEKKDNGGFLGTLMSIGLAAFNLLKDTVGQIVGAFGSLISMIPGLTTVMSGLKAAFSVLEGALGLLASPAGVVFGLMASMGLAIKFLQDKLLDKEKQLGGEKGAEMMSEQLGDMAAGAGDAMGGGTSFVTGTDVTGKKLGTPEDILQNRKDYIEQQKRQQGADTLKRLNVSPSAAGGGRGGQGGPTAQQLSPTPVPSGATTGPNGEFKSKEDFLTTMYPLAVKASEKLGGVDPNALLTQWGFESAWGSKTSGKYNYFGIKADKSWSGDKKDVMTTEFLNGENVKLPQPFRSYGSPEEAVDDYVSFLKNNKRYERAGVFQAQSSSEYFGALQKAGYATDPNYASKLTSATESTGKQVAMLNLPSSGTQMALASPVTPRPSTGSALTTASVQVASASQAGTTVINNNTTNNTKSGGAGQGTQSTPNIPSAFDDVFNTLFGRVT
jgi:flagellar protein FlgJ